MCLDSGQLFTVIVVIAVTSIYSHEMFHVLLSWSCGKFPHYMLRTKAVSGEIFFTLLFLK